MMQMDPANAARHANGTFLNRHQGGAPPSRDSLKHARWGDRHVPLRLHNSPVNLLTGALLLGSLGPGTGLPGPVAAGRRVAPGAADAASAPVALLPAAQASGRYAPVAGPGQAPGCGSLGSIANGVVAACVARPRSCSGVMALGALAAVGGLAYVRVAGSASAARYAPVRAREWAQQDALQDTVAAAEVLADDGIPVRLEAALLQIARDCGGDRRCRADAINAVLLQVPPATLTQLRQIVARTVPAAQTQQHGGWPLPGAMAAPWIPESALLDLAATLADLYTPAVAAFQDDMEAMVGATVGAGDGRHASDADIRQRWFDANARRQDAIAALLVRDAGPVERLPYALHGLEHLGIADGTEAFNLHVSLPAASTPPTQRVLLVAHGDMIGRALGSEGAYDNASGVATLLHIARQWQAAPSNAGIQLELLVTSHEELGLLGARAYVKDCLQHESCPTFVINVDMTGRGGRGYAISGTGDLAGRPHLGKPTMYLQAPRSATPNSMHAGSWKPDSPRAGSLHQRRQTRHGSRRTTSRSRMPPFPAWGSARSVLTTRASGSSWKRHARPGNSGTLKWTGHVGRPSRTAASNCRRTTRAHWMSVTRRPPLPTTPTRTCAMRTRMRRQS